MFYLLFPEFIPDFLSCFLFEIDLGEVSIQNKYLLCELNLLKFNASNSVGELETKCIIS